MIEFIITVEDRTMLTKIQYVEKGFNMDDAVKRFRDRNADKSWKMLRIMEVKELKMEEWKRPQ